MQLSDRIGRRMKLQDLHVFLTVVNAGGMGKAAGILNSTQPISRDLLQNWSTRSASACWIVITAESSQLTLGVLWSSAA